MSAGLVRVFHGITKEGKPGQVTVFITGLDRPFGIDFYPAGPDPQWVYIANNTSVVRFPYKNGDVRARAPAEHIMDLPEGGHSTRDVRFSPDGKKMFVSIGSFSNVDDPSQLDFTSGFKNLGINDAGFMNAGAGLTGIANSGHQSSGISNTGDTNSGGFNSGVGLAGFFR